MVTALVIRRVGLGNGVSARLPPLLPQPHGFEGLGMIAVHLDPDGELVAKRPDGGCLALYPQANTRLGLECAETEDLLAALARLVERDHERLPWVHELQPEPPEAVMTAVEGIDARERAGGAPFNIGVKVTEHALDIAPIPRLGPIPHPLHVLARHRREYHAGEAWQCGPRLLEQSREAAVLEHAALGLVRRAVGHHVVLVMDCLEGGAAARARLALLAVDEQRHRELVGN